MLSWVLVLLTIFALSNSQTTNFYLSPNGVDTNVGTSPSSPWRTLSRAAAGVRSLRPGGSGPLPGPVNVNLAPGNYQPFALTSADSGDSDTVLVSYIGSDGAVVSGGVNVHNWVKQSGENLWKARSPTSSKIRQLWVNGSRIPVAQTEVLQYEKMNSNSQHIAYSFQFKQGDVNPSWRNFESIEVLLYHSWVASIHQISNIDTNNRTIFIKNPSNTQWDENASGSRYVLLNVFEKLQTNSFYYDAEDNSIYYYSKNGENPNQEDIVVSNTLEVLTITGTTNRKVQYIKFEGIMFGYSDVDVSDCFSGTCDAQSVSFLKTATVHVNFAQYLQFVNVVVAHTGGYGIWLNQGCNNNVLSKNYLYDLGAGGVRIGVPVGGIVSNYLSIYNTLNDSLIENGGFFYEAGCGVLLQAASDNTIAHNEIRYFRYTGISLGWTWDYQETSQSNNFVGWNHIHHIGLSYLSDMGCIYHLGISPGSVIYNNLCHDVSSYNYGGWGLYTDQASTYVQIKNNIVYNTKCAGFHQHFGENNLITNNIIAYSADDPQSPPGCTAAVRSSQWAPGSGIGDHSSFTFNTNIVYITDNDLFLTTNSIGFKNMTLNNNVYWSTTKGGNLMFPPTQAPVTFEQWKAEGKDVNSILADPQFVDPTNYNFNLKPTSPALKLGFVPIDTSNIGPRQVKKWNL